MGRFALEGLDHVAIAVADLDRSKRFYAEVLGLAHTHRHWDVPVVMTVPESRNGLAVFSRDFSDPDGHEIELTTYELDGDETRTTAPPRLRMRDPT